MTGWEMGWNMELLERAEKWDQGPLALFVFCRRESESERVHRGKDISYLFGFLVNGEWWM
jgi:hypothetical protein